MASLKLKFMSGAASFDSGDLSWSMIQASIPASQLVNVTPNVLPAGGAAIAMNGVCLTTNTRVPIGTVPSFPTLAAVGTYFGASSSEYAFANKYFGGYIGATAVPGALLFAQYPQAAVSAYLRGGNLSALSLTGLQALSGSLNLTMDGYARNVANISLAGAVSFSAAATTIQTALNGSAPGNLSSFTGSIGANGSLTVTGTGIAAGVINPGTSVSGTGVVGTVIILSQVSGSTGGTGVYATNATGTLGSQALTTSAVPITVTFDSVSSAFIFTSQVSGSLSLSAFATGVLSGPLLLTQAGGAVISQGAVAATPGPFMTAVTTQTQNWGTFTTLFSPDAVVGTNTNKLLFAAWVSGTNNRYAYMAEDTDLSPTVSNNATSSFANQVTAANYSGVCSLWQSPTLAPTYIAAFVMGTAAAINFNAQNGRITFAFRGQSGMVVSVTDPTVAANLIANGYNFYGAYATATQTFQMLQPGSISAPWNWLDSYINQIWLNANFQSTLLTYLANTNSVPYTQTGYSGLENALQTPIAAGLNFGAYRAGVVLSSSQIQSINTQAGKNVAGTVSTRGWYLQILDPGPTVRAARGSPICTFFYADGESVQQIQLTSIDVQ